MERLNYHHLLYFHTVAQEGSVARASRKLGLKQPTISAQIHSLEERLGCKLLERSGRGLKTTPAGKTVLCYAERIFAAGGALLSALEGHTEETPRLVVGATAPLPPAITAKLLSPCFAMKPKPALTLASVTAEELPAQISSRSLDFALSDLPLPAKCLHSRVLLQSPIEAFVPAALAAKTRKGFPESLEELPLLMPCAGGLRREVDAWLAEHSVGVRIASEMQHPENFAADAVAVMFAPALLRDVLRKVHGLLPVGSLNGYRWRVFLISAGKGIKNPALDAVVLAAKEMH